MSIDNITAAKLETVAHMLDGRVAKPKSELGISAQGYVVGFPCRLEALNPNWPFGVNYFVDTEVITSPNPNRESFSLDIIPRVGKGILGFFARLLIFEASGMKVGDKELDKEFICTFTKRHLVERFLRYPGVSENLLKLHKYSSFNELKIESNAGLYLSQPVAFSRLDLDNCRETFTLMGEVAQVLYEAF